MIFFATVGLFVYSGKMAFEKVRKAKMMFDEDIARIGRRSYSPEGRFRVEI
ncbi:hypothetical protein [Thermococcus peptonophilus]|uniref:hypothetical protein n=1 Tax=Thermococcus peptonophilus TaxID=53952 RepID=UPI000A603F66|nr:hypothetical protein [Thermococcus peptonophilus]